LQYLQTVYSGSSSSGRLVAKLEDSDSPSWFTSGDGESAEGLSSVKMLVSVWGIRGKGEEMKRTLVIQFFRPFFPVCCGLCALAAGNLELDSVRGVFRGKDLGCIKA